MCYSALVKRDLNYLEKRFGATIIREQVEEYERASTLDPKRFPPSQARIFPGHYAPVIFAANQQKVIALQRYGAYPPPQVTNPKAYTTFNARRDNLSSTFWSDAFMVHHGFCVLEGFYEWVSVKDLIKAGVVSLAAVKEEFGKQAEDRKAKILAAGKTYKPTPTELKDPLLRQIIIEFRPDDGSELLVPTIFSYGPVEHGHHDVGFAIITDDPGPEIVAAGHDRCPVILEPDAVDLWLDFKGKSARELTALLARRQRVTFRHRLAEAA